MLLLSPQIDQDNADNFAREYADSGLVYYEYEYEDDDIDDSPIGTGDLYDPNSLKDDTAYYYKYSHKLPVPSEAVQSELWLRADKHTHTPLTILIHWLFSTNSIL